MGSLGHMAGLVEMMPRVPGILRGQAVPVLGVIKKNQVFKGNYYQMCRPIKVKVGDCGYITFLY